MNKNDAQYLGVETTLGELLRERTGYELNELDRDATFLELGFDSLFLIQLSQQLKKQFGAKISFRQLIEEIQTINLLVPYLTEQQSQSEAAAPWPKETVPTAATVGGSNGETNGVTALPTTPVNSIPSSVPTQPSPDRHAAPVAQPQRNPVAPPNPAQSPPTRSQPVQAPANAPIQPPTSLPAVVVPTADAGAIEQIILQQNVLMAQHLAILSSQPVTLVNSPPTHSQPNVSTEAESFGCSQPGDCSEPFASSNVAANQTGAADGANTTAPASAPAAVVKAATPVSIRERFGPYKPIRKGLNNGLTDRQRTHLDAFMERFTRRTIKSRQLAETHRSHFADPRGVSSYRRIWKPMVYQIAVEHSQGAHLRDIDSNRYVDIAMGFGLNLFGQSPDFVTKALHEQLDRGVEVGPQSPIAGEVAKMLCEFSRKDRVTFCNTGSEAVMAALRIARTVTGKSKFVYFNKDYHGNFDQVLCRSTAIGKNRVSAPAAPGVPQMFADNSVVLDYGTPEALQAIQDQAEDIAAVLVEPVQSANPFLQPREFMHEVRRLTKENNIAMIMDEVITGFRAAQGGAQEWFDVWADMSTYGKILGGGMPIGALAGNSEYMDALDGGMWRFGDDSEPEADMTFFAGTFVRHPLGLVAAREVLKKIAAKGPKLQRQLTERTTHLVETLNTFFEQEQFPIRVAQFASQFRFMFPPNLEYADLLYFHMLDRGVFTRGWGDNCFLSTAHSDEDIEFVIDAIRDSCLEIRSGGFFPDAVDEATSVAAFEKKKSDPAPILAPSCPTETDAANATIRLTSGSANNQYPPSSDAMSTISEIQPLGTKTPIFCTCAADGFTRVFHELSDQLGDEQPMFGLDSPGIYGESLPDSLEEFCAGMVNDIRETQPQGPYLLLGYCSGGTVALEVAHQLIAMGQEVAMLGKIETYNWYTAPSTHPTLWTHVGYEFQRIEYHVRNFLLLNLADKQKFLTGKWNALKNRTAAWKSHVTSLLGGNRKLQQKQTVDFDALWRKHDDLCEEYVPKVYPGKIIHFRPAKDYKCHVGEEVQATDGLEIHRLRAYPAGMMVGPFVNQLAEFVQAIIDRELGSYELSDWYPGDSPEPPSSAPPKIAPSQKV